jgi:hypothetical protein
MARANSDLAEFSQVFAALKPVLGRHAKNLHVVCDTPSQYTLVSAIQYPLPQKKGERIYFGAIKAGKAYVSFHLFPLYMNPELSGSVSPELRKRMHGKTCFNFRTVPEKVFLKELDRLTTAGFKDFRQKKWV